MPETITAEPINPPCPICKEQALILQQREPPVYWCAMCRKWFNEKLERI